MTLQLRITIAAGIALATFAPAFAQIVTPPPATAPKVDDHIERAPLPPQRDPSTKAAPPIRINTPPARTKPAKVEAPDLKFESIVHRDAAGKVIPLTETVDLAALRNNPALKPGFMDEIAETLAERKAAFQRVAIDNLDIVEKVENGAIEKVELDSKDAIKSVVDMIKPLKPPAVPNPLTQALLDAQKISPEQAAMNRKIMKEYQDALLPPLVGKDATPADRKAFFNNTVRTIQREGINEVLISFEALRRTALTNLAQCLPGDLGKAESAPLLAAAKGLSASSSDADFAKAYHALETGLNLDQRRDVLRKAATLR
ncbi:MAG: hypothetical protein WC718_03930 [Phycisphaerales bacterium]